MNEDGTVTVEREYQDSFKTKENLLATITAIILNLVLPGRKREAAAG